MQKVNVYFLRYPNPSRKRKNLVEKYWKAVNRWKSLKRKLDGPHIKAKEEELKWKLHKANKEIRRIKKEIIKLNGS